MKLIHKLTVAASLATLAACITETQPEASPEENAVEDSEALTTFSARSFALAVPIAYGTSASSVATKADDFVAFKFQGRAGDEVRFRVQSVGDTLSSLVLGRSVVYASRAAGDPVGSRRRRLTEDGEYFIMVRPRGRNPGLVRVQLERLSGTAADAGVGDAGSSPASDAGDAGPTGLVWGADGIPTCEGDFVKPSRGDHRYAYGVRFTMRRDDPSSRWRAIAAETTSTITLRADNTVDLQMTRRDTYQREGGVDWICRRGDCQFASVQLDERGDARTSCRDYTDCNPAGGSSSGGKTNYDRQVMIQTGATCTTIADVSPRRGYSDVRVVTVHSDSPISTVLPTN